MKEILKKYHVPFVLLFSFLVGCEEEKKPVIPEITTTSVSNIGAITAESGGNITSDGGAAVTTRGVCWSTNNNPSTENYKTIDGQGTGIFSSNLTNLNEATNYYVRAYATNSVGTAYGMAVSFTTRGQSPTLTTSAATNITPTSAIINGSVNANYLSTVVNFEYGITANYGNSTPALQNPITGNTNYNVSASLTGLSEGTTYHYRIVAVNSLGTSYGNDFTFTTFGQPPIATTRAATNISTNGAVLNGIVNANALSTVVSFEYGLTTSYGNSVLAMESPITGITTININAVLNNLSDGTTYHYRIKAINNLGTVNGADMTFTTSGFVTDIDGNIYNTLAIGTQIWMKENLATTKFNDGTPIQNVTDNVIWASSNSAYCWYNNDAASYKSNYGALYNFFAVYSAYNGAKNICPIGWHVPSDADWKTLILFTDPNAVTINTSLSSIAGGKLKESGITHWQNPNIGGTNEGSFTALPGGSRNTEGTFFSMGKYGSWWTSTALSITNYTGYSIVLGYDYENVFGQDTFARNGLSVRCLKD